MKQTSKIGNKKNFAFTLARKFYENGISKDLSLTEKVNKIKCQILEVFSPQGNNVIEEKVFDFNNFEQ